MSYAGDPYNRLETLVAYPHCPDDEVREYVGLFVSQHSLTRSRSLYGVRRPITFTEIEGRFERGKTIFVGQQLQQSALTQSVDKVFKCSWPDVLLEEVHSQAVLSHFPDFCFVQGIDKPRPACVLEGKGRIHDGDAQ